MSTSTRILPLLVGLLSLSCFALPCFASAAELLPDLPEEARGRAVFEEGEPRIRARLLIAQEPVEAVGVLFELAEGWHVYWRNPGETGIATDLAFETPGRSRSPLIWPAPQRFEEAEGLFTTYGYEDSVLLSSSLAAIPGEAPGERYAVEARALICRTECVPVSFSLSSPRDPGLPAAQQARVDALFEAARSQAPRRIESLGLAVDAHWTAGAPARHASGRIRLAVRDGGDCAGGTPAPCPGAPRSDDAPFFLPLEAERFELEAVRLLEGDDSGNESVGGFALDIDAVALAETDRLQGLVPVRMPGGERRYVEVDVPIVAEAAATAAPGSGASAWIQMMLLALVGGLILNGMPCVLPVLAIKAVAVADLAERDPREVRVQGLAYTAGVLASMAALAGVVIGLRAAGHSVGWGFQFQEPLFVAVISAVVVAFALNLFGVFEIDLGQGRLASVGQEGSGVRRSLFEGLLAVVLATPCTAPFLGTAVGFAFAAPGAGILAIFLVIGLGLALPFLLVCLVPGLARFVPRSGPWTLKLRAGLGWALLATAAWLLWILGRSGGADAIVATLLVLLGLSFLLWTYGQLQPLRRPWLGRVFAVSIVGLALAGFNLIGFDRARGGEAEGGPAATEGWAPWSEEAVETALAAGRPVFVDFTADWCLTCQVNERTVLARDDVRAAFLEHDFALFEADWTQRDERIRRKLAEFGRAGVPLYLVYSPDAPKTPRVLSELLGRREVLTAITFSSKPVAEKTMDPSGDPYR